MDIRRFLLILIVAGLAGNAGNAQTALSVCAGYNHLTTTANSFTLNAGVRVGVLFVPTQSIQVTTLEYFFPSGNTGSTISINIGAGTFEIRANDPVTNLPSNTIVATAVLAAGGVVVATSGWRGPTFPNPVILNGAQPYWLTYTRAPSTGAATIGVQNTPAGPDTTVASFESGGAWSPVSVVDRFKVRLRSTNCTPPGPLAAWNPVGVGCTGTAATPPSLTTVGLPVIGSPNNGLLISGGIPNAAYGLFISYSGDPVGVPIGAGCSMYLEINGFLALATQGLNPLLVGTLNAIGSISIPLPVPNDPTLSGVSLAFEAAMASPSGIPVGAGFIHVTIAQVASIGL